MLWLEGSPAYSLGSMSVMGRERVAAALALDRADRPAVGAWGHSYAREWSLPDLVQTTVALARGCDLDFVKLQVRMTCFAEAFGAEWRYSGSPEAEPVMLSAGGTDLETWRRIAASEARHEVLEEQVRALAEVAGELGPATPCLQTVFSPGMVAWFLTGRNLPLLFRLLSADAGIMTAALTRIAETLAWFAAESLRAGAAGVFYAINPTADISAVPPAIYEDVLLPHDRTALGGATGAWFNMLHLCGPRINTALVERLRPHCVNWSTHDEGNPALAELRDRFGVAVVGGLHRDRPIRTGTPAEVRVEAEAALRETAGRGHVLAPGCSVSPWPGERSDNVRVLAQVAAAS